MKKLSVFILSLAFLSFVGVTKVNADCSQIYGGGTICPTSYTFNVQKFVQRPDNGNYTNSLSINDPKFSADQTVKFQIIVQNTGSQTIPTITIVDIFPQYINYVSDDSSGSFDSNAKTLTVTISNLGSGQSKTINVTTSVVDTSLLPSVGTVCVVNTATGTDNNGATQNSQSQLCIQKSVLGAVQPAPVITTTPPTGPEMLPLALLIPGGLGGLVLRKKSTKNHLKRGGEK